VIQLMIVMIFIVHFRDKTTSDPGGYLKML
jgi:hypothetical protein